LSVRTVSIHYRRPPDRLEVFEQRIVAATDEYVVTFLESAGVRKPIRAGERTILEPGSPVVWFTYPGQWHDIGRFHLRDGTFTGIYANILTPVQMRPGRWDTTDLFLDVWVGSDGEVRVLDEDEFEEAVTLGWIEAPTATTARAHAAEIVQAARAGTWPPAHVAEWDLERVIRELQRS
jgi:predicted RNA-binding protein associated with RNAse of E/G family